MPVVRLPSPLQGLTDGEPTVEVPGGTVREALAALDRRHPGVAGRVVDADGDLHRHVNVFVGERDVRELAGVDTPVTAADVVTIVPAVAGG